MPKLNKRSLDNLAQCHPNLQKIAAEAIKEFDFIVICGHRGKEDQNKAYAMGKSKLKWPNSKHNKVPSLAMDIVPWPLDWNDLKAFGKMLKVIEKVAKAEGIRIRLGRDFKGFADWPHVELA